MDEGFWVMVTQMKHTWGIDHKLVVYNQIFALLWFCIASRFPVLLHYHPVLRDQLAGSSPTAVGSHSRRLFWLKCV
jgi:hypothetical protein